MSIGKLDYGRVTGPSGFIFTGYLAAVKTDYNTIPEIFFDCGTLNLPGGFVFTGDFSITFRENSLLSFKPIT